MSKNKEKEDKEEEKPIVAKTAVDLQRLKLMKLMKNPDKPIILPERPKAKNTPTVPEFVRNVMGSSAGAGSGEFHVYRHLRRKEYARQKFIQEKGRVELLDDEYHRKVEDNKKLAEEAKAKKREKRMKKKQKWKQRKRMRGKNPKKENENKHSTTEEESSDEGGSKAETKDAMESVAKDTPRNSDGTESPQLNSCEIKEDRRPDKNETELRKDNDVVKETTEQESKDETSNTQCKKSIFMERAETNDKVDNVEAQPTQCADDDESKEN